MVKKIILSIVTLSLFASCATTKKIEALKPEPDDAAPFVYETTPSFVSLPVNIKLKDIENQTNKFLTGLIYEDNDINNDDIEIKIWKQAPINIENQNGKIKTVLPLKAVIKYRIGTSKLGFEMYETRDFNLDGVITLVSDVQFANWKMNTKTELKSINWNESPSTTILGKSVPITYLIKPAIHLFRSKIEKSIDEAISKSVDFKPNVLEALEKVCTPFQMNEAYETWLRLSPVELYATTAKFKNETILMDMGLKCNVETLVGQKPVNKFDKNKIVLKNVTQMPNLIAANIVAVSTYQDASKIINKNFAGQEFGSGSKKVIVKNVALWHKSGKMIVALDLLGSVNGTIYLSGYPQYNDFTKEIYFDQLDYVLDTKSKLLKTANWLAQGYIITKMQEMCRYSIQPNLDEGKQNLMKYLKNYNPIPGVFVNGNINTIQFQKIQLTNKGIIASVKVNGEVKVSIDGLK